jgi:phosphatidylinositol glycan class B
MVLYIYSCSLSFFCFSREQSLTQAQHTTKHVMKIFTVEQKLLILLLIFRIINCLIICTAFDPDEYWQSLEVAHRIVFG